MGRAGSDRSERIGRVGVWKKVIRDGGGARPGRDGAAVVIRGEDDRSWCGGLLGSVGLAMARCYGDLLRCGEDVVRGRDGAGCGPVGRARGEGKRTNERRRGRGSRNVEGRTKTAQRAKTERTKTVWTKKSVPNHSF